MIFEHNNTQFDRYWNTDWNVVNNFAIEHCGQASILNERSMVHCIVKYLLMLMCMVRVKHEVY